MNDWREELIEKMGKAFINALMFDDGIRAALAVAEPVIREQCARVARKAERPDDPNKHYEYYNGYVDAVSDIAAAIREGGREG